MNAMAKSSWLRATVVLLLLLANRRVNCATILLVPFPFPSHVIMLSSIGEELVHRGHQVYVALETGHTIQNVVRKSGLEILQYQAATDVVSFVTDKWERRVFSLIFDGGTAERAVAGNLEMYTELSEVGYGDCAAMMSDRKFLDRAGQLKFDIAIVEAFFICPCKLILARYLKVPFVSYTGALIPSKFGIPALPSYTVFPVPFGFPVPAVDSFLDRIHNTQVWIIGKIVFANYEKNVTLLQQFTPDVETWNDLISESQLVLIDYDHIVHEPLPLLPHVVDVAGCTAKPAKPLPPEVGRVLDESEHGVILVAFGSLVNHLPVAVQAKIMDGFSRLNQTVLMKFSANNDLVTVPPNVRLLSWLPINDILADKRTRLFMTHCGINAVQEGIFHAVPMLGLPLFAEQSYNCYRIQVRGVGTCLDVWNFTAAQVVDSVRELLTNESYQQTVDRLSAIVRDQPLYGSRKAAHWVEHVMKFGGRHLQSPVVKKPQHKLYMFDLLAVVFVVLFVFMFCVVKCFECLFRRSQRNRVRFRENTAQQQSSKKTE